MGEELRPAALPVRRAVRVDIITNIIIINISSVQLPGRPMSNADVAATTTRTTAGTAVTAAAAAIPHTDRLLASTGSRR